MISPDLNKIIEERSFKSQAKRASGIEKKSSYLRKGVVGDWKNHFSIEAKQLISEYLGDRLIALGYEKNNNWVSSSTGV